MLLEEPMRIPAWPLWAATISATLVAGCMGEEGAALRDLRGIVTYHGKPVSYGQVTLYPEGGAPYPPATLQADGRFAMRAAAGKYKVVVEAIPPAVGGRPDPMAEGGIDYSQAKPARSLVPLKYARPETSDVTVVVDAESEAEFAITLK